MSRLMISPRTVATKNINLGKIIIFCEGDTERYYFEYFAEIIKKDTVKYNNVVIITQNAGGNAQAVLNYAESFLKEEKNNQTYSQFGKYLIFDCDAPPNIASVINDANRSMYNYDLLVSNHFFETWLLMHFEDIDNVLSKRKTYEHLSNHLSAHYKKARKGLTREILQNGDINKAINFAKKLDKKYLSKGMSISGSIDKMNPYSNVYKLVEQLLELISP